MPYAGARSSGVSGKQCYTFKITKSTDSFFFLPGSFWPGSQQAVPCSFVLLSALGGALSAPCSSSEPRSNLPQP